MLKALNDFPSVASKVKAPRLFLFDRENNFQVLEDIHDAVDVASVFVSPMANVILTQSVASAIGLELGSWLRAFHDWTLSPAQSALRKGVGENEPMRKLKRRISYDSFIEVLENFPGALDGVEKILDDVKEMGTKEFERKATDEGDLEGWGLIHGDFWMGK